jgi:hypothetical protein
MAAVDESVDAALSDKTKKNRKHYATQNLVQTKTMKIF